MKKILAGIAALVVISGCVLGYMFFIRNNDTDDVQVTKEVTVARGDVTAGVSESSSVSVESLEQSYDLQLNATSVSASVVASYLNLA